MSTKNDNYPAIYTDKYGTEHVTIHNDGRFLSFELRGLTFYGIQVDLMSPLGSMKLGWVLPDGVGPFALAPSNVSDPQPDNPNFFRPYIGDLCEFELHFAIPILMDVDGNEAAGLLHLDYTVARGDDKHGNTVPSASMRFEYEDGPVIEYTNSYPDFEWTLTDIKKKLPNGHDLKCCFRCQWSDYSPSGNPDFGGLACFRGLKEQYSKVRSKWNYFEIERQATERVQETYLCPEFEWRVPGTGYRG